MNNLVSVDTSHSIAASIFRGLACSEPARKVVQGISTCHQWLHAGRPSNGSEYVWCAIVLWHVCSLLHWQPDLFNTFQQHDGLGTVVLPSSLGSNSDRDWLCDSHSLLSMDSMHAYLDLYVDSDGAYADVHVFQYGVEDSDRSVRVGMGIARHVDSDADGLDRDVDDSDHSSVHRVHGIRGVTRTGPHGGLLTNLIQRWNQDISCSCLWYARGDDACRDGWRPGVWTDGTATWNRTRTRTRTQAVHWDAVSPTGSLSILHEACHGMRALSHWVQPGQGHVDSDPDVAPTSTLHLHHCLETLSVAHGLHDIDTWGHLESERRGPLNRHRAPSRAGTSVHVNDRQTLSALQDPHEARGLGVIVKALVQQNAGASLFLRTIVCIAALLCCAHSMLVPLGERPSFNR